MQNWLQKKLKPIASSLPTAKKNNVNDKSVNQSTAQPNLVNFFPEFTKEQDSAPLTPALAVTLENALPKQSQDTPSVTVHNETIASVQSMPSSSAAATTETKSTLQSSPIQLKLGTGRPRLGLVDAKAHGTPEAAPNSSKSLESAKPTGVFSFGLRPVPTLNADSKTESSGLTNSRNILATFKVNLSRCLNTSDPQDREKQLLEILAWFLNNFKAIPPCEWNDKCFMPFSNTLGTLFLQSAKLAIDRRTAISTVYSFSDPQKQLYLFLASLQLLSTHQTESIVDPLEKTLPKAFTLLIGQMLKASTGSNGDEAEQAIMTQQFLCKLVKRDVKLARGFLEPDSLLGLLQAETHCRQQHWQACAVCVLREIFSTHFTTSHRALQHFQDMGYLEKILAVATMRSKDAPETALLLFDLCLSILKPAMQLQNTLLLTSFEKLNGYTQICELIKIQFTNELVLKKGFEILKEFLVMGHFDQSICEEARELPFQFEDFKVPPINTKAPLLQNERAIKAISEDLIQNTTNLKVNAMVELLALETINMLFGMVSLNNAGYFTIEHLQLPAQWVSGINSFPARVQDKIMQWIAYGMTSLRFVPARELSILFSFVGESSNVSSSTKLGLLQFVHSFISNQNETSQQSWIAKMEELGLFQLLIDGINMQMKHLTSGGSRNSHIIDEGELEIFHIAVKCLAYFMTNQERCIQVKNSTKQVFVYGFGANANGTVRQCVLQLTVQIIKTCNEGEQAHEINRMLEFMQSTSFTNAAAKRDLLESLSNLLSSNQKLQVIFFECNGFQALMSILAAIMIPKDSLQDSETQATLTYAAAKTLISAIRQNPTNRAMLANNKTAVSSISSAIRQAPVFSGTNSIEGNRFESLGIGILTSLAVESIPVLDSFMPGERNTLSNQDANNKDLIEHPEFLVQAIEWLPALSNQTASQFLLLVEQWLEIPYNSTQLAKIDLLSTLAKLNLRGVSLETLVKKWLRIRFTANELRTMISAKSNFSFLFTIDALQHSLEEQMYQPYSLQFGQDFSGLPGLLDAGESISTIRPFPPLNGYTFLAWLKIEQLDDNYPLKIISILNGDSVKFILQIENKASGKVTLTTPKGTVRFESTMLPMNAWFQLAIVHQKPRLTASQAFLYVNGQLSEQVKCSYIGHPLAVNSIKLYMGDDGSNKIAQHNAKTVWYLSSALFLNEEMLSEAALLKCYQLGVDYAGLYLSDQLDISIGDNSFDKQKAQLQQQGADNLLSSAVSKFSSTKPLFHFSAQNTVQDIYERHFSMFAIPVQASLSRLALPGVKAIWNTVGFDFNLTHPTASWTINPAYFLPSSVSSPKDTQSNSPVSTSSDISGTFKIPAGNFALYRNHMSVNSPQRAIDAIEQMGGTRLLLKFLKQASTESEIISVIRVIEVYIRQNKRAIRDTIVYSNQYLHVLLYLLIDKASILGEGLVPSLQIFFFDVATSTLKVKQFEALMLYPSSYCFWSVANETVKSNYLEQFKQICSSSEANAKALAKTDAPKVLMFHLLSGSMSSAKHFVEITNIFSIWLNLSDSFYDERPLKTILYFLICFTESLGLSGNITMTKILLVKWLVENTRGILLSRILSVMPINFLVLVLYPCVPRTSATNMLDFDNKIINEDLGKETLSLLKVFISNQEVPNSDVDEAVFVVSSQLYCFAWAHILVLSNAIGYSKNARSIDELVSDVLQNPNGVLVNDFWMRILVLMVQKSCRKPHEFTESLLKCCSSLFFSSSSFENCWVKHYGIEALIESWHQASPKKTDQAPYSGAEIIGAAKLEASPFQSKKSDLEPNKPLPKTPSVTSLNEPGSFKDASSSSLESYTPNCGKDISKDDLTDALQEDVGFVFVGTFNSEVYDDDNITESSAFVEPNWDSLNVVSNSASSSRRGSSTLNAVLPANVLQIVKDWLVRFFCSLVTQGVPPLTPDMSDSLLEKTAFAVSRYSKDLDYKIFHKQFILLIVEFLEKAGTVPKEISGISLLYQMVKVAMIDQDCFSLAEILRLQGSCMLLLPSKAHLGNFGQTIEPCINWLMTSSFQVMTKVHQKFASGEETEASLRDILAAWLQLALEIVQLQISLEAANDKVSTPRDASENSKSWIKLWFINFIPLLSIPFDISFKLQLLQVLDLIHETYAAETREVFSVMTGGGKSGTIKIDGYSLFDGLFVQKKMMETQVFEYWLSSVQPQFEGLFGTFYAKYFQQEQDKEQQAVKQYLKNRFQIQAKSWQRVHSNQNQEIVLQKMALQHLFKINKVEEARLQRFINLGGSQIQAAKADFAVNDVWFSNESSKNSENRLMKLDFTETRYRMRNKLRKDDNPQIYYSKHSKKQKYDGKPDQPTLVELPDSLKQLVQTQTLEKAAASVETLSKPPPVPEKDSPKLSKSKAFKAWLEQGDAPVIVANIGRVTGLDIHEGVLLVSQKMLCLIDNILFRELTGAVVPLLKANSDERDIYISMMDKFTASNLEGSKGTAVNSRKWHHSDVLEIHKRLFLQRQVAVELFLSDGQSELVVFRNSKQRDQICSKLWQLASASRALSNISSGVSASGAATAGQSGQEVLSGVSQQAQQNIKGSRLQNFFGVSPIQELTDKWLKREMSNFQYLMNLNTFAGRSYNDLTQYPVFPWILSNYRDQELDLSDPTNYRDLSKPMGAIGDTRAHKFMERFQLWDDPDLPACHYGVHYSSAMIVCSYLIRLEPFTLQFIKLQGGYFDHPDRLFSSIDRAYKSASEQSTNDVRELIPEFFYMPEFLENSRNLDLGTTQDGKVVGNVLLPPWAHNSSRLFVETLRRALESEYVSQHLHEWIDLIFGFKQQGEEAVKALNTFHYLSYEAAVDMDNIENAVDKQATVGIISNFGQTPRQLFKKPHPKRQNAEAVSSFFIFRDPAMLFASREYLLPVKTPLEFLQLYNKLETNRLMETSAHAITEFCVIGNKLLALSGCKGRVPGTQQYVEWGFMDNSVRIFANIADSSSNSAKPPVAVLEQLQSGFIVKALFTDETTLITAGTDQLMSVFKYNTKTTIATKETLLSSNGEDDEDEEPEPKNASKAKTTESVQRAISSTEPRDSGTARESQTPPNSNEVRKCTQIATWRAHEHKISCLVSSHLVRIAVSGDEGGVCNVWDLNRYCLVRSLEGLGGKITAIAVNETFGTVAACSATRVILWSVNGDILCEYNPSGDNTWHNDEITCVSFYDVRFQDSVEDLLAIGTKRGLVRLLVRQFDKKSETWVLSSLTTLEPRSSNPLSCITSLYLPHTPRVVIAGDIKGKSVAWVFPDGGDCEWHFQNYDSCQECNNKFAVLDKRQHCKCCGASFCNNCFTSFSAISSNSNQVSGENEVKAETSLPSNFNLSKLCKTCLINVQTRSGL